MPKDKYYVEEIEIHFPLTNKTLLRQIFDRLGMNYNNQEFISREELAIFLSKYKYFDEVVIKKNRHIYIKGENEITVDDVSGVGIIIELECMEDEPTEIIKHLLKDNEWDRTVEGLSYAWMRKNLGLTSHLEGLELFKTNPIWNVWESETEMYRKLNKK